MTLKPEVALSEPCWTCNGELLRVKVDCWQCKQCNRYYWPAPEGTIGETEFGHITRETFDRLRSVKQSHT